MMYTTMKTTMGHKYVVRMAEDSKAERILYWIAVTVLPLIGTVGLTLGITPSLGLLSHLLLILLMFLGRVEGLTLIYAAVNTKSVKNADVSRRPVEKINVG